MHLHMSWEQFESRGEAFEAVAGVRLRDPGRAARVCGIREKLRRRCSQGPLSPLELKQAWSSQRG